VTEFNLAQLHEAIAEVKGDVECIVFRDRRLSWGEVTDRTRRLANLLLSQGLGQVRPRTGLEPWESGQDHVALFLRNGNEYLEGMLGAYKARCAPFNVNYRYTGAELTYLFEDARPRAVIFHGEFAPLVEEVRKTRDDIDVLIQVADDSGAPLLDGAIAYEDALAQSSPERPPVEWSPDDLYLLYTGGTTGMPKGVLWRQADIIQAALSPAGVEWQSLEEILTGAQAAAPRWAGLAPFMHGAGHWAAFIAFHSGGTIVIPDVVSHLDPENVWTTVEREGVQVMVIVGNAFARPLAEHAAERDYDLSSIILVSSGGASLTPDVKEQLNAVLPNGFVYDVVGASETGAQAHAAGPADASATARFSSLPNTAVLNDDKTARVTPGSEETGWLAASGRIPLGYLGDPEKTARTFPLVDGVRYSVPGDRVRLDPDGTIVFAGREAVTINSGGEKIFAEEVERAVLQHPDTVDAVVVGAPSEKWGQEVVAVVQLQEGATTTEADLLAACEPHIARYKLPKRFVFVPEVVRGPVGKPDYRWAATAAGIEA
jgi:fatty-acyl-CoA synthase